MNNYIKTFKRNLKTINKHYLFLISNTKKNKFIGIVNEWIVDNYVKITENKNILEDFLNINANKKKLKKYGERLYLMLSDILSRCSFKIDYISLIRNVNKYQSRFSDPLVYEEISLIKPMILLIVFENLSALCEKERLELMEKEYAQQILNEIDKRNPNSLKEVIDLNESYVNRYVFLDELFEGLSGVSGVSKKLYLELTKFFNDNKLSLKYVINSVHADDIENNLIVENLIRMLKIIGSMNQEYIVNDVSFTEKVLSKDKDYSDMNDETKDLYRLNLCKLAKKHKIKEYDMAVQIYNKSKDDNKHVGFYLIKNPNYKLRVGIYLSAISFFTLALSMVLSILFPSFYILSVILLLLPTSELVIQIINRIMCKIYKPNILPKMDFSKGIPDSCATMVVIPTIVKDTKKIDIMFNQLEKYCLANISENLYFTLLSDACEMKTAEWGKDSEIAEYGLKKCEELNKKYNKPLFYFVYKRRQFTKSEDSYLGYERKRGSLLHFNKLLLKTFSNKDIKKYFICENVSKLSANIKYVITLDTDSELIISSASNMVATMAHPLNQPVLDEAKNKVVSGYGIMQPKVNLDIEAAHKSVYVKLFGGLGGFDVYNSITSNLYQDSFGEGSFMGKGIYDLNVFQTVLENRFPECWILSHDLLESTYLRSAQINDVEIIDDFPSRFLPDMSRHHRWARGDTQILPWLGRKVKNAKGEKENNPINALGKWKIFDNIRRMFLDFSLLIVTTLYLISPNLLMNLWFFYVAIVIGIPILFYLLEKIKFQFNREKTLKLQPFKNLMSNFGAVVIRSIITFITIPYRAMLYLNAFFKALYRMIISKKRLLNWLTAEEAEKTIKNNLSTYIKNFKWNYIYVVLIIVLVAFLSTYNLIPAIIFSIGFISAPILLYNISKPLVENEDVLKSKEKKDLLLLASKTWRFFEENLTEDNRYLIPDNYQNNREFKVDIKTSTTNIGFSLLSIISANKLGMIDLKKANILIQKILTSVSKLKKWNGHLYNWYSLKTFEPMYPQFVSSADSGNFVASLFVVREFLKEVGDVEFEELVTKLIDNSDFSCFYQDEVFSVGYNSIEGELSVYNYNKFASESRLTSFIAIAKGDVPTKHWFCLDKSLARLNNRKGLSSWAGGLFEYYMPFIFMKVYPNTLLEESYDFAYYCQRVYMKEVDESLPWGISECAYDELDYGVNYKYKSFSIPYLKPQEEVNPRIVISPYSSLLVLPLKPKSVYTNLEKFVDLKMIGKYGLYEAYDTLTKSPVYAYFAHHQGMILSSIANYLNDGVIQNYFGKNINIQSVDILSKEKMQLNSIINLKIEKYKKVTYQKEKVENDVRTFSHISTLPEMSVLSNADYTVLMNDRGNGFSRFKEIQLNRYRKVTEQDYGTYLFIKDVKTNKFWSNTYSPINKKPEKYEVVFASDKIKYVLTENDIITTTEIVVTKNQPAEIRKITLKNISKVDKELELTTYLEPTITENSNDVVHRAFNSLFLTSFFDSATNSLIMKKHLRNDSKNYYLLHKLFTKSPKIQKNQYETIKSNFVGPSNSLSNPLAMNKDLTNSTGTPIDPIMSLRNRVVVPKGESVEVYILNAFGTSKDQVIDIAYYYDNSSKIDKAYDVVNKANVLKTKMLNVTGNELRLFNTMLNYLYQTTRISINNERKELLIKNAKTIETLWKFGISGDRPLIVVSISDISEFALIKDLLKAFEWFKANGIIIDIAIINDESTSFHNYIDSEVDLELYRMESINVYNSSPGKVYVIDGKKVKDDERILLNMVSRLKFDTRKHKTFAECIESMSAENNPSNYKEPVYQKNVTLKFDENSLINYNGFGGFNAEGNEYIITNQHTPTPWSNILANKEFGSIITNNGCGFTYAFDSNEYKLTSWTNDISALDESEGIRVNNEKVTPQISTFGFGYVKFESSTKDYKQNITQFVPLNDKVKVCLFEIKNLAKTNKTLNVDYWINPVLGQCEEKTSRYILSEFNYENNALEMRNVFHSGYSNVKTFISSDHTVSKHSLDKVLTKSITVNIALKPNETKKIVFVLGAEFDQENINAVIKKYSRVSTCEDELESVKNYWKEKLGIIKVSTPDSSLNFALNGWYLYQSINSRIYGKLGFYQVSGAFGYRDQLQDCTNLCVIDNNLAKSQIINNAKHQFIEGDVTHWWIEKKRFGLRSRYKDDAIWLIYSTSEYLRKTNDYSILNEQIPFIEGDKLKEYEAEKGLIYKYTDTNYTLLEHLKLIIENAINDFGVHGIPKIGGGDWNDGMNKIGIQGRGESVWLGFFLYDNLNRFIEILEKLKNENSLISKLQIVKNKLFKSLNSNAWDGEYYLRAYFDNGDKLGSKENIECKIDLLSQSWAILSDVADTDRTQKCLEAVAGNLVDDNNKIVKLLTPAFAYSHNYPGYILDYPEGIRENGGQYTHAVSWYVLALLKAGEFKKAYEVYANSNPINRTKNSKEVSVYKTEPYVIAADVYSNQSNVGRGGWTWYTGSAAWFYKVGIEDILGIKVQGNKLLVEPQLDNDWKEFSFEYIYKSTKYKVNVKFDNVNKIEENGKELKVIELVDDGKVHEIVVTIGGKNDKS